MPNYTENYGLKKPLPNENYNVQDHNDNMDIIDTELKKVNDKVDSIEIPVTSVNGKTGDIELTAADIGAETPAGAQAKAEAAAAAAVAAHEEDPDPHEQYALEADLADLQEEVNAHKADYVPHLGTTTNDGNGYTVTSPVVINDGYKFSVKFNEAATDVATLTISSDGVPRALKKPGGGDFKPKAGIYTFIRDGVNFQCLGEGGEYGTATPNKVLAGTSFGTEDGVKAGALAPKLTNLIKNGSFENDLNCWIVSNGGVLETNYKKFGTKSLKLVSPDGSSRWTPQKVSIINGHKYYGSVWALRTDSVTAPGNFYVTEGASGSGLLGFVYNINDSNMPLANTWYLLSGVAQAQASTTGDYRVYTKSLNPIYLDGFMLIDLTDAFGEGNEPDKATMDAIVLSGNILGEDGNCEDATSTTWERWHGSDNSVVTDTKAFGSGCIKCVVTNDVQKTGGIFKTSSHSHLRMESNKYYMLSAYVKDGNSSNHKIELVLRSIDDNGDNIIGYTSTSISTTGFTRIAVKGATSSNLTYSALYVRFAGGSENVGNYFYVDGVMLNEITEDDYNNLSIEELLEKYPYTSKQAGWWDSDLTLLTSDANATAAQILSGNTAYVNGVKVTGTMPNIIGDAPALEISRSGTTLKLRASKGYYDGVNDNVTYNEPNWIAANIPSGISMFGLTGSNTNKKWAEGTVSSDTLSLRYLRNISFTTNLYGAFLTINGLSFTPSRVFITFEFDLVPFRLMAANIAGVNTGIHQREYKHKGGTAGLTYSDLGTFYELMPLSQNPEICIFQVNAASNPLVASDFANIRWYAYE